MTTVLSPPAAAGLAPARHAVAAAAQVPVWTLTDPGLAAEITDALTLRAQADALLLTRLGEADARGLARTRGATSLVGWLRGAHRLGAGDASRLARPPAPCTNSCRSPPVPWPGARCIWGRPR